MLTTGNASVLPSMTIEKSGILSDILLPPVPFMNGSYFG